MSIYSILSIIGALGFFIYGMKVMSEGIQKAAGDGLRSILKAITSNRVSGIFTGFLTTSIIQSSSATTVMIVSFVNAGLLSLRQAIGVIMGANIGTTMTAWILVLLGFSKFSLASYALPILALGVPMLFMRRNQIKSSGEFLIGFALLFMGLSALKGEVKGLHLEDNQDFINFITGLGTDGYGAILLFVFIGTLLTVIVQSSSAAMALTLIFVGEGLPLELAAAIVLGENIGTTVTANLAALIGNVHSKRAARAHLLFNIFGVIWMLIVFFPFIEMVKWLIEMFKETSFGQKNIVTNEGTAQYTLALFHTCFNIINMIVLVWFVNFIEKMVIKMTPSKSEDDEEYSLEFINAGIMATTELSIMEAKKEIKKFGKITRKMNGFVKSLMLEQDNKKYNKILARIKKYEETTDRIEVEIADYLAKAAQGEMSVEVSIRFRGMLSIIGDLERIGDIYYQMSKSLERKKEAKIWFTPEQRESLLELSDLVEKAFEIMYDNLSASYNDVTIDTALEMERVINAKRDEIRKIHFKNIEKGKYNIISANSYSNLFHSYEKIGDHIINVTEGLVGSID
jgi:phosphate:Na+ symporter